jgi:hypothetical protein
MPRYSRIQLSEWFLEFMKDKRADLLNPIQWPKLPEDTQILAAKHLGEQCEVSDLLALLDHSQPAVAWWAAYHLAIMSLQQTLDVLIPADTMQNLPRLHARFADNRLSKFPAYRSAEYRGMWCRIQCKMIEVIFSLHQPPALWQVPTFIQAAQVLIGSVARTATDDYAQVLPEETVTKWREIVVSTKTDKEKAERVLLEWYKFWQCSYPSKILWCQSPMEGAHAAIKRLAKTFKTEADSHTLLGLHFGLEAVGAFFNHAPSMPFRVGLSALTKELVAPFWEGLRNVQLEFIRADTLCGQVRWAFFHELSPTPGEPNSTIQKNIVRNSCFGGQLEWEWLATLEHLKDAGAQFPLYEILAEATQHCGFWWPFSDYLIVTEKPTTMALDEQGRFHSLSGPALAYADGWSLYRINGIAVPAVVVLEPEKISVAMIEKEPNVELRRIFIDRYGPQRYIRDCNAEAIDTTEHGVLYRKAIEGDEPLVMVKVVNASAEPDGSRKEYFLRVPPNITSVEQAIGWTFGMEADEYKPVIET